MSWAPGVDLVKNIAERPGEESPRGVQNRHLHRLMGEAIVLERAVKSAPGGKFGVGYLWGSRITNGPRLQRVFRNC